MNLDKLNYMTKLLDGVQVEWKNLWQVTTWDKKFNAVDNYKQPKTIKYHHLLADELKKNISEKGNVKLLTTNETNIWTTEEIAGSYVSDAEVVAIPGGGNVIVQYYRGKFLTGDNRIAVSNDSNYLNTKYLYYYLKNNIALISSFYRGSGIKHPSMANVLDIQIPIPPLHIQEEIVRILDTFTELTTELTTELNARKKQYEYYRDKLLTNTKWTVEKLKDIAKIYLGLTYTPTYVDSGIKFISAQNTSGDFLNLTNVKYISEEEYKNSTSNAKPKRGDVLFTRVGSNLGHPVIVDTDEELCIFVSLGFIRVNPNKVFNSYIKHWMNTDLFWNQVKQNVHGSAKVNLNTGWLNKFEVLLPSLAEQELIVSILDKFEAITNSITEGLPREIELRQKQYEYYREMLLTFPNAEC